MSDVRYNVGKLFKEAFGINSPVFITETFAREKKGELNFKGIEYLPEYYQPDAMSWMGTPIMFQTKLTATRKYKRFNNSGLIEYIALPEFTFPPATLFSFRRSKDIIRTKISGGNGTVKEIFSHDDWQIDVKGLCLDEPNISAQKQIENLLQWERLADSIDIEGSEFLLRNIFRVCITDFSSNIPQGKQGVVSFQMSLIGDEAYELGMRV